MDVAIKKWEMPMKQWEEVVMPRAMMMKWKLTKKVGVDEAVEDVTIALGSQASNFSKTS